jgi:UDP-N-acetylglucosamine 3-dehydrogenase
MMGLNHVRVLTEIPGVEVVGVADPQEATRAEAARRHHVATFASIDQLLEATRPEVMCIATPTKQHEECAAMATARGVHVLIEKPIAPDLAAGHRIAEMVREAGLVGSVGHVERFNPALRELGRRLAGGELGQIFHLETRRIGPFPARIRDVGVVRDLATHDLDLVRFLLGQEVEYLFAQTARRVHTEHEDLVHVLGRSTLAVILVLEANWVSPVKIRQFAAVGEGGMFVADSLTQDLFFYENSFEEGSWRTLQALRGVSEGNMTRFAINRQEPLRAELEAFIRAVRDRVDPPCPLEDGIEALRLAELCLQSASTGQPVLARPA